MLKSPPKRTTQDLRPKPKTKSLTLTTTLSNYDKDAVPDVKVKWWLYGN